jgi:hypothetical protein
MAFELSLKVELSSRLVVTVWSRKPDFLQEEVERVTATARRIGRIRRPDGDEAANVKIVRVFGPEKGKK